MPLPSSRCQTYGSGRQASIGGWPRSCAVNTKLNDQHPPEESWMVRAVGIEPTLLSEPDFESGSDYSKILDYIEFSRDFALVC